MATQWQALLRIQKFRRVAAYAGFYCFYSGLVYAYTNNSTRAGISRADQYYSSYPAGTELLSDVTKLYKAALGNVFEVEDWGPIEFSIMAKHFERQGKSPYAYHAELEITISRPSTFTIRVRILKSIYGTSTLKWGTQWYRFEIEGKLTNRSLLLAS